MSVRVLNLLNRDHRRGAEAFAVALGGALTTVGFDVTTVALAPAASGPTFPVDTLTPQGTSLAGMVVPLRQAARDHDVVIGHGSDTLLACAVALAATGVPFVYRTIGDPDYWATSWAQRLRVRAALSRAAAVAVYHQGAADALRRRYRLGSHVVRIIPKGIDIASIPEPSPDDRISARHALGIDLDAPVVLVLGALSPEKNVEQVIDAVAKLPGVILVVAGVGPCRQDLEARAAHLGARATFIGGVDNPRPVLAAADVVVLTSRTEGVPTVALEAALSARPMVATDVGGVATVVRDSETGFLVAVGDVSGTAVAIERAIAARDQLGRRARQRCVEEFALDAVATRWAALVDEVTR